jgi:hypothetical protein
VAKQKINVRIADYGDSDAQERAERTRRFEDQLRRVATEGISRPHVTSLVEQTEACWTGRGGG